MSAREIKTTGQLRQLLANAISGVLDGSVEIEKATALHKLTKNITDSLYSEAKISMFHNEIGEDVAKLGDMRIGED